MDLGGDNNARLVAGVTSNVADGWHMIALHTGYRSILWSETEFL